MYLNILLTILILLLLTIIAILIYWWVKFGKKIFNIISQINMLNMKKSNNDFIHGNPLKDIDNIMNQILKQIKK